MAIFWRLVLAHFIADFTLQTNHLAKWKRRSRWGMAVHILTHPLMYILLTWPFLGLVWVQARWFHWNGWVCMTLITLFHWLEDEWRVGAILQTRSPDNTLFFLWDQLVHLAMILALSPSVFQLPAGSVSPERWVGVLLCAVLLTHFSSVLIYFLENDVGGRSDMLEGRKYQYIAERLVGASLFLLPGAWLLLAVGWIVWLAYLHYSGRFPRTWVHLVVGNSAVVLLSLIARGLLYS